MGKGESHVKYSTNEMSKSFRSIKETIRLHASKKESAVNKSIEGITDDMKNNQENLALIKAEALINNERTIETYQVLVVLCERVLEKVHTMEKFKEPLADLESTFASLIYSSDKTEITDLVKIKHFIEDRYGKKYVQKLEKDFALVNDTIREKILLFTPKIA